MLGSSSSSSLAQDGIPAEALWQEYAHPDQQQPQPEGKKASKAEDSSQQQHQQQFVCESDLFSSFQDRLRRPLYLPEVPENSTSNWERFSLPLTEVAVNQFRNVDTSDAQKGKGLGRLDPARAYSIARQVCVTSPSLVLALIFLERMKKVNPKYLNTVSSTDIFLVSLMISSKFLHDDGEEDEVFNEDWAEAGQVSTSDMNRLEIDFLSAIDWSLLVSNEQFETMTQRLEAAVVRNEASKRHWSTTYSDMAVLLDQLEMMIMVKNMVECAWKFTAVLMTGYTAQLMTMLGTVYILNKTPFGPQAMNQSVTSLLQSHHSTSASSAPTANVPDKHLLFPGGNSSEVSETTELPMTLSLSSLDLSNDSSSSYETAPLLEHAFTHHETSQGDFALHLRHPPVELLSLKHQLTLGKENIKGRGENSSSSNEYVTICPMQTAAADFLKQVELLWGKHGNRLLQTLTA